jgi:hypothetical protein
MNNQKELQNNRKPGSAKELTGYVSQKFSLKKPG